MTLESIPEMCEKIQFITIYILMQHSGYISTQTAILFG